MVMGYMDLTEKEKKECKTNSTGKIILIISFLLIFVVCFAGGGTLAAVIGMVAIFGFIVGFFMTFSNRNKGTILYQKEMALKQANLNIQLAQAGLDPYAEMVKVENAQAAKKAATKEIIKGAVVGGIVAGDAGAVVGAMIAQNKIDNQVQSNNSNTKKIIKGAVVGGIVAGDAGAIVGAMVEKNKIANSENMQQTYTPYRRHEPHVTTHSQTHYGAPSRPAAVHVPTKVIKPQVVEYYESEKWNSDKEKIIRDGTGRTGNLTNDVKYCFVHLKIVTVSDLSDIIGQPMHYIRPKITPFIDKNMVVRFEYERKTFFAWNEDADS